MPAGRRALRVLCFGDSLTAGTPSGNSYAHALVRMVQMALPTTDVHTLIDGEPGATVLYDFAERMRRRFPASQPLDASPAPVPSSSSAPPASPSPPLDWVIVLGGTNDVGRGHDPERTFEGLKATWDIALSNNTRVLALTVPEIAMPDDNAEWRDELDATRDRLNNLIREHERENFYVYDLHNAMRYFAMPPHDRDRYWNDIIHFTAQGYDMMGEKIGVALVHILVKEKLKGEGLGRTSPPAVNQEYVVVQHGDAE